MKKYVIPTRIICSEKVQMQTNLLKRKDLQMGLKEDSLTEFQEGSSIVLDYGEEHCGGVRCRIACKLRRRCGVRDKITRTRNRTNGSKFFKKIRREYEQNCSWR